MIPLFADGRQRQLAKSCSAISLKKLRQLPSANLPSPPALFDTHSVFSDVRPVKKVSGSEVILRASRALRERTKIARYENGEYGSWTDERAQSGCSRLCRQPAPAIHRKMGKMCWLRGEIALLTLKRVRDTVQPSSCCHGPIVPELAHEHPSIVNANRRSCTRRNVSPCREGFRASGDMNFREIVKLEYMAERPWHGLHKVRSHQTQTRSRPFPRPIWAIRIVMNSGVGPKEESRHNL